MNQAMTQAHSASQAYTGRLMALKGVQSALTGVQAYQAQQTEALKDDSASKSTMGVTLSWGSQSSTSTHTQVTQQNQGSQLIAGQHLMINAQEGDIRVVGSTLQAGNDLTLLAQRDVVLTSSQNRQQLTGNTRSQGATLGVGIHVGSGKKGVSIDASLNSATGRENGIAISHNETRLDAGKTLQIVSGRDTQLQGAQVSGHTVDMTVGRHLTLTSEQQTDHYFSSQTSGSVGGSASMGGGSFSLNLARDKMDSTYRSVQVQTGIFAGQGGFTIDVGKHTQLNGAVIGSTASAENNQLQTGTLGFNSILNHAQYKVEHQSVGLSTGSDIAKQLLSHAATSLLVGAKGSGRADSVTYSAISQGSLTILDSAEQSQS
ncbi:adhesin, partial [Rosenbergiella australiborealis]|nr:adhesin [Rosenbergiella australiborealis]